MDSISPRICCFQVTLIVNTIGLACMLAYASKSYVSYAPDGTQGFPNNSSAYHKHDTTNASNTTRTSNRVCSSSDRADELNRLCELHGYNNEPFDILGMNRVKRNLFVDDRHKIIYCDIPKCGSSTFKHYLGTLNTPDFQEQWAVQMKLYHSVTGIRKITMLSRKEVKRVLKEYFKFVVVRHPFDRLRSAWQHKLSGVAGPSKVLRGKSADIANDYMKGDDPVVETSETSEDHLSFHQFLDLVGHEMHSGFKNPHWLSFYEHCQPCHIRYDHVFRLETLPRDVTSLYDHLHSLNVTKPIPMVTHDNNIRKQVTADKMDEIRGIYSTVEPDTIRDLINVYRKDFALFGYHWRTEDNITCSMAEKNCC